MTDPLRTISGFAEVLVESDLEPQQRDEYAQHILDSSLRLTAMLQRLLAYARAGTTVATTRRVALAAVLEQVRDDLAIGIRDGNAELIADLPAGAAVMFDPNDLRVVFQNLVSNAIKFGDPHKPVVTVRAEQTDDGWRVSVTDNGSGIAPEDQARIFGAFERGPSATPRVGYGLGLAICQRLIERDGGRIGVESPPGGGASIWFDLPGSSDVVIAA